MKKYTPKSIFKKYAGWKDYMKDSWERGEKNLEFIESSNQWSDEVDEKEKFIFNYSKNILQTAKANAKQIDLDLSLKGVGINDQKEERAFNLILTDMMLSGQNKIALAEGLDKVYSFGQAVYHVKGVRATETTLNQVLRIECLKNPKEAFFDYGALSPTFHDGNFCGRVYHMEHRSLIKIYKNLATYSLGKMVKVADFWFKEQKEAPFFLLETGEYKREDLIDSARDAVVEDMPPKKGMITSITYVRAIEGYPKFVERKRNLKFQTLPMVFDYGGLTWTGKKYDTFPLGWELRDAQLLLNYCGSVMGDMMKGMQGDRWLFDQSHLKSETAKDSANTINTRSGGLVFTGDISRIRREVSQQIPAELVQVFMEFQNLMQRLSGGFFEQGASKLKAISGVALDKMFSRADLIQNSSIVAHLHTINVIGEVVKGMIPVYYTENRTIGVKTCDGTIVNVEINKRSTQPNGMVVIENDVNDLSNRYEYNISAAPSESLENQNTENALGQIYKLYPQAIPPTIDVYVKSLNIKAADILSRRLSVGIPKELVDYGCGEISYGQYQQIIQQKQQQAQQAQMEQMANSPDSKYIEAKIQGEQAKAQTESFKAQTERFKETTADKNAHIDSVSNAVKVEMDNKNAVAHTELELLKVKMRQMDEIIKSLTPGEK